MTPNDAQIDVLMRRYAGQNRGDAAADHLDADELNAFAEGSVPPATRARYVSHLADCDNCRQLVSQLAMNAGAVAKLEPAGATATRASWWQSLFAPARLKYAAFALVLIAAAGALFLLMQRPRLSNLTASSEPTTAQAPGSALKSDNQAVPQATVAQGAATNSNETATTRQSEKSQPEQERDESRVAKDAPPPPKPSDTYAISPPLADKKAAEQPLASKSGEPSYAPPPPREGQRAETTSREQQNIAGIVSGPRKSESSVDKLKTADLAKEREVARDRRGDDDTARARTNSPVAANRRAGEKPGGPQRNADNIASAGRNANERQVEEQKQSPASPKSEDAPETRSVGGRKFRRQGGSWIDTKFKSSMSLKTVSRVSEEFSSLDSGLRSIASQFSGEIIVVWKNKAYRIH
jgi:hypothetical protein